MTDPSALVPRPEWVYKRDGRLVPFEADKISRALFSATERLGQPDSFLARELTDSVLHFLTVETEGTTPTTAQIADLSVKVVRELGHPALAEVFAAQLTTKDRLRSEPAASLDQVLAEFPPSENSLALVRRIGAAQVAPSFLRTAFGRDIQWTHAQGLLTITGLEATLELSGWLLGKPGGDRLVEFLEEARALVGGYVAIDGPEYLLPPGSAGGQAEHYARELGVGLRATGLRAVVNLNCALPPPWAGALAEGPLFGKQHTASAHADLLRELLWEHDLDRQIRVDWHLGERDFAADARDQLTTVVRRALSGARVAFAFDRPRRAVPLAEGIDRQHPAALLAVRLDLMRLLESVAQQAAGHANSPDAYLHKLGSLGRLALSAGVQKRSFLRRLKRPWPAFLLDRARLLVVPQGLDQVVARFHPEGVASSAGLELGRRIIQRLADTVTNEAHAAHMDACLDTSCAAHTAAAQTGTVAPAGLLQQLKTAAALYKSAGIGTATIVVPPDAHSAMNDAVALLHWAWQHTDFSRARFVLEAEKSRQLSAPWEDVENVPGSS